MIPDTRRWEGELEETKVLSDELGEKILKIAEEFLKKSR